MGEPEAGSSEWMEQIPENLYDMLATPKPMEGPASPHFPPTSPGFPELHPTSTDADLEISPVEPMATGEEQDLEIESMELLSPEEIFTRISSKVTSFAKDPAMIKVQRDINPIAAAVQEMSLLFCEPGDEKVGLLDDMRNAVDNALLTKTSCKMVSIRTIHGMAKMLSDTVNMVSVLAQRYCQFSKKQVQLLQTEVADLTTLACNNITVQKAAEDIVQPKMVDFLQPSFMEKPETAQDLEVLPAPPKKTQEAPPTSPSPTAAGLPSGPAKHQDYVPKIPRPLTFENEALAACKDITNFAEDVLGRVARALPAFQCLLADANASSKVKAEVFRYITTTLHIKGAPKDLLDRADRITGQPVMSSNLFPPLLDLRPTNEYCQNNRTFNYLFDSSSKIFLRNRLITIMLSLTSPYATASVITLVASGHQYLKTLFNTEVKNPWVSALRYSVLQSCIFSLENNDNSKTITNNSQLFLPTDLSAPNFQNSVRLTRHIHWPEDFKEHFSPQDNTKPMKYIDILHNKEISYVRSSLQIRPAKKQRIQKRK